MSFETLCVEGVHISHVCTYCHHNDDYGAHYAPEERCDGACRKQGRRRRPIADEILRRPGMVDAPDELVELARDFLAGKRRKLDIPRPKC
jgi:hypothetical protein